MIYFFSSWVVFDFFYIFSKNLEKTRFSFDFLSWSLDRGCEPSDTIAKKIKGKPSFFKIFAENVEKFEMSLARTFLKSFFTS